MASKYRNRRKILRAVVEGIQVELNFASFGEAARWRDLTLLQQAGEIFSLERQVRFPLLCCGVKLGHYVADFTYCTKAGEYVVEDFKGYKTPMYKWKKKHLKAQYGYEILETGPSAIR